MLHYNAYRYSVPNPPAVLGSEIFTDFYCLSYVPTSVEDPDPGSGAFFDPWIRDTGWVRNQDPVPGSGSWMNNPDHTVFPRA